MPEVLPDAKQTPGETWLFAESETHRALSQHALGKFNRLWPEEKSVHFVLSACHGARELPHDILVHEGAP